MHTIEKLRTVPISKVALGEEEIDAAVTVLRSGNLREGYECRAFEEEFAAYVGSEHALTASSGTAALHMAYAAILEPGDEVLVPAFTFFATASMVVATGGVPIFCDIQPDTLTIDVADAAQRLTRRTKAIAPVHIFGNACDVAAIEDLARAHKLHVIWDAAQAHGTQYAGRDIGGLGDVVAYSFYPSKNMTTGEGGMVCTNDADLVARMKLIRSQGQAKKYYHTALGYNFRMTDVQAAIGRVQLRRLPGWVAQRRANAATLRTRLANVSGIEVQREQENSAHSYHQFSILIQPEAGISRDKVLAGLHQRGIEAAVHYPTPLHKQPFFRSLLGDAYLPVSEAVCARILSVPVHPFLNDQDVKHVADSIIEVVGSG
jgi:perosamine synthetase